MRMTSRVILNVNTIALLVPDQNVTDGETKKLISGGSIKYVRLSKGDILLIKVERRECMDFIKRVFICAGVIYLYGFIIWLVER